LDIEVGGFVVVSDRKTLQIKLFDDERIRADPFAKKPPPRILSTLKPAALLVPKVTVAPAGTLITSVAALFVGEPPPPLKSSTETRAAAVDVDVQEKYVPRFGPFTTPGTE